MDRRLQTQSALFQAGRLHITPPHGMDAQRCTIYRRGCSGWASSQAAVLWGRAVVLSEQDMCPGTIKLLASRLSLKALSTTRLAQLSQLNRGAGLMMVDTLGTNTVRQQRFSCQGACVLSTTLNC